MKELNHDTYLVTGAAGFIGSHIAEGIVRQGKRVVCVDNFVAGKESNLDSFWDEKLCSFINCDVSDFEKMRRAFDGVDVVFHNAASKCTVCRDDPATDLLTNALGSHNVFAASVRCGVKKVIHASTGSVNNGNPKSFYGVSKQAGENYLKAFKEYYPDFNFTSIRYHHVFGPRQEAGKNGGVVAIFITQLLKGGTVEIHGDGFQKRHLTYVKDVVDFNFRCEDEYDCMFVNIAEQKATTINELYEMLSSMIDSDHNLVHTSAKKGDIRIFDISDNAFPMDANYEKRFRRNLKETIESYA